RVLPWNDTDSSARAPPARTTSKARVPILSVRIVRVRRSGAAAVLAFEMAAGLHGSDDLGLLALLLAAELRIFAILRVLVVRVAIEPIDEAAVVELADMVHVPQRHRVDLLGVGVVLLGLLVDIRDRRHARIELGF